jgi:hypothetical protein
MLYPLSYRGIDFNGVGMLTLTRDLVNRVPPLIRRQEVQRANEKRSPEGAISFARSTEILTA